MRRAFSTGKGSIVKQVLNETSLDIPLRTPELAKAYNEATDGAPVADMFANRRAVIAKPSVSVMQNMPLTSAKGYILTFVQDKRWKDPLMDDTSSSDPAAHLALPFPSLEDAVAYAESRGISYQVKKENVKAPQKGKAYSANFKWKGHPLADKQAK